MKSLEHYLTLGYPYTIRPDIDDNGYIVEFPLLHYCVGTGDTIEEAIADAMVAKEEWLRVAYDDGIPIPEP